MTHLFFLTNDVHIDWLWYVFDNEGFRSPLSEHFLVILAFTLF